uniref:TRAF3 interacting protein 3 n=1 Tax=Mola mola TaxID=94237 RepID=A0A3Q3WGE3_MOLML
TQARCSEELLRNEIKALEAQLQICLQKLPKEGMKKLVLQMEKQKLVYEEKVLVVLQKATQEKTEEALMTAKAEALRWQNLYEELKLSSGQLRESQLFCNEQLQQLHSQVELSRARDAELREEVASLRQEKKELQYNFCLLEEDNQALRDEIQDLRCDELQTELCTMEQECQSSQARLSQCRQELRQLSQRNRRTLCGPWWKVWMFFLLLLAVVEVAMLWLWLPPFRELVAELYSDIEARIEDYLLETDSPEHSSCFRPI